MIVLVTEKTCQAEVLEPDPTLSVVHNLPVGIRVGEAQVRVILSECSQRSDKVMRTRETYGHESLKVLSYHYGEQSSGQGSVLTATPLTGFGWDRSNPRNVAVSRPLQVADQRLIGTQRLHTHEDIKLDLVVVEAKRFKDSLLRCDHEFLSSMFYYVCQ